MNISSPTSATANYIGTQNVIGKQQNSAIASLMKFKENLQDQIKSIQASKEDPNTKQEKLKEIQAQIQQIDQEIAQLQAEEKKRQAEKMQKQPEESVNDQNSDGVALASSLTDLLASTKAEARIDIMIHTKKSLEGDKSIAVSEMKNSVTGASNAYQIKTIANADGKISGLATKIGIQIGEVDADIHWSKKTASENHASDKSAPDEHPNTGSVDETNDAGMKSANLNRISILVDGLDISV